MTQSSSFALAQPDPSSPSTRQPPNPPTQSQPTEPQPQPLSPNSPTPTFYFAYGSNLSTSQMRHRCPSTPPPIAVAKLPSHTWFICQRGYANITPVRPPTPRSQPTPSATTIEDSEGETHATTIWGLIYRLPPTDEPLLDTYEGWSPHLAGPPNPDISDRLRRPLGQGACDYNKLYLPVQITRWLAPTTQPLAGVAGRQIRALVYVDEHRLCPGRINAEYTLRLSRAALQCVPLGVPAGWIEAVWGMHGVKWWKGGNEERGHDERRRAGSGVGFRGEDGEEL